MKENIISRKQIISIFFILILLVYFITVKSQKNMRNVTFFYTLLILSITFTPMIRGFKFSRAIRLVLYYVPMFLPLIYYNIDITSNNLLGVATGILFGIILLLSNHSHNKKYISKSNIIAISPIDTKEFLISIYIFIVAIIGEELFFRYFFVGILYKDIGHISILLSSICFVHSHYINRWSNIMFNKKSYLYHLITGVIFSAIYIYTGSVIGSIVSHSIFNSPELILLVRRVKNNKQENSYSFDDY